MVDPCGQDIHKSTIIKFSGKWKLLLVDPCRQDIQQSKNKLVRMNSLIFPAKGKQSLVDPFGQDIHRLKIY